MSEACQEGPGAREPRAGAARGRLRPAVEGRLRTDAASPLCGASGWALRLACTDDGEHAICPVCSRRVGTRPGPNPRLPMRIVVEHPR